MRSLVLVAHGSYLTAQASLAVDAIADWLRGQGQFGEVVTGYWQQEPSLRQVLKTVQCTDVTVVPMLLSEGELSNTVMPRELGLGHQGQVPPQGVTRVISGLTVHYTRPYGTHAATQQLITQCALEELTHWTEQASAADAHTLKQPAAHTALYLVAYAPPEGNLGEVMETHAQALRSSGLFGAVRAVTLPADLLPEGLPPAEPLPGGIERVVAVPFMQALSPAGQLELLEQLRQLGLFLPDLPLYCTQALGQHPAAAQVVLAAAQQARTPLGGDLERGYQERWAAVLEMSQRPMRLGEVLISPHKELLELRHALDEGLHSNSLTTFVTLAGLRQQVRHDAAGRFRPLSTLRTLPRGWRAVLQRRELPQALQLLYPGVIEESFAHHHHALRITPWAATAQRLGLSAAASGHGQVERATQMLCSGCLRTPIWANQPLHQTFFGGVPGGLPCAEACSLLVATVREQAQGQ